MLNCLPIGDKDLCVTCNTMDPCSVGNYLLAPKPSPIGELGFRA